VSIPTSGSDQPKAIEPVPVQLTRIEGTVNLIAYQFGEVKEDIKQMRGEVSALTSRVQAVELAQAASSGASSSWRLWLPTIIAAIGVLGALGLGGTFGR
jgi:ABC-type enterobactin transport system permease subunit